MFAFATPPTRQLKSRKKFNYLNKYWLVASPLAPRLFRKSRHLCKRKSLAWPRLARETKWRTQLKNSNDAICVVCLLFFLFRF